MLGLRALGIETDEAACATARAAGHERLQGDVAELDPLGFGRVWGLVGSPPCQAYSTAGKGLGRLDKPLLVACAHELAAGNDSRRAWREGCRDERSLLTVEPLRYALALRPRWIALEQVPAVLELWSMFASLLGACGYHTATGVLSAERYGVPQTRKRAILLASLDGPVKLPDPTHRSYDARRPSVPEDERDLLPWVSMAEALGWTQARASTPGALHNGETRNPCIRGGHLPAPTIIAHGHQKWTGIPSRLDSRQRGSRPRPAGEPAPTMLASGLAKGVPAWTRERPATTIACDPRVHPGGHKQNAADPPGRYAQRRGVDAARVTVRDAAVLQGFRADYPWQGARGRQLAQVGNALPPPLAHRVLQQAIAPGRARRRRGARR